MHVFGGLPEGSVTILDSQLLPGMVNSSRSTRLAVDSRTLRLRAA